MLLSKEDFYLAQSVLHPLGVGIPLTFIVWIYLRMAPNRLLANLTKFDWIVTVTLGSTLSRGITGSADLLDMTRATISLAVIILFQLGLAYITTFLPNTRNLIRAEPQVVVFRGEYMQSAMGHSAVLKNDIRIGMRRHGVLTLAEIEVMFLEAAGGFTIITRAQMEKTGMEVPDALQNVRQYLDLLGPLSPGVVVDQP